MMKKIFLFCFILLIASTILAEELSEEEFQKKLDEFKSSGDITVFTQSQNTPSSEQQNKIIQTIPQQNSFWNKWHSNDPQTKTDFWKKLDENNKNSLLVELSKKYNFDIKGFDDTTAFGQNGIMGNARIYLDAQKIEEYNKNAGKSAIKSIDYNSQDGQSIIKITKVNGENLELVVDKDTNGFYFDPKTNKLVRSIKQTDGSYKLNNEDPLSGVWNGKGNLKIEVKKDESKITLGYSDNKDYTNFAKLTTKETFYSPIRKPTGELDENGKPIIEYLNGEITIRSDGKLTKLSNVYLKGKWGGFFGDEVDVFYSLGDYETTLGLLSYNNPEFSLGNYIIVDEETGFIAGDVKRRINDKAKTASEYASGLLSWTSEKKEKLDNVISSMDRLSGSEIVEAISKGTGIEVPGFSKSNLLNKFPQTIGASLIENTLKYASDKLTSAENLASHLKGSTESPIFRIPQQGSLIKLELSNELSKKINAVDLRGGSLSIQDNTGEMVKVIEEATPYNYYLNRDFNKKNPKFSDVNFNLVNSYIPDQEIKIYSNSQGNLIAQGLETNDLEKFGSRSYHVQGNVNVAGRFGVINIDQGVNEGLFSIQYQGEPASLQAAQNYLSTSNDVEEYRRLYNEFQSNGFTEKESNNLKEIANKITSKYYDLLSQGNSEFSINSISSQPQKFNDGMRELSQTLIQISKGNTPGNGANLQIPNNLQSEAISSTINQILKDPRLQDQIVQRGLLDSKKLETTVRNHLGEIGQFIQNNRGTSLSFVEDSKNNLYQIKYGEQTFNIDPALGPIVSEFLPRIVGSTGVNSQNEVYINPIWNGNRLIGDKDYVINFERYYSIRDALRQGESNIQASVEAEMKIRLGDLLKKPQ